MQGIVIIMQVVVYADFVEFLFIQSLCLLILSYIFPHISEKFFLDPQQYIPRNDICNIV
jgi:hypothetical protein